MLCSLAFFRVGNPYFEALFHGISEAYVCTNYPSINARDRFTINHHGRGFGNIGAHLSSALCTDIDFKSEVD
jgi:hypothetical protein